MEHDFYLSRILICFYQLILHSKCLYLHPSLVGNIHPILKVDSKWKRTPIYQMCYVMMKMEIWPQALSSNVQSFFLHCFHPISELMWGKLIVVWLHSLRAAFLK